MVTGKKSGNDTTVKVSQQAQGFVTKRIRRLRGREHLVDRQKELLEKARGGVLRIETGEPEPETDRESVVGKLTGQFVDRLTSIDPSSLKPW